MPNGSNRSLVHDTGELKHAWGYSSRARAIPERFPAHASPFFTESFIAYSCSFF
jgi:hypothetical protein